MKGIILYIFIVAGLTTSCSPYVGDLATKSCNEAVPANTSSTQDSARQILNNLVKQGVPGAVLSIQTPNSAWSVAQGLAKVEDKTPMALCHLQYLQSISKTYLAVCLLKLYEENKIDLDSPMTKYLPEKYSHYIDKPSTITVRMLMNHTSGIPEYNSIPTYITTLLQHPDRAFTPEDYLKYIDGKPLEQLTVEIELPGDAVSRQRLPASLPMKPSDTVVDGIALRPVEPASRGTPLAAITDGLVEATDMLDSVLRKHLSPTGA